MKNLSPKTPVSEFMLDVILSLTQKACQSEKEVARIARTLEIEFHYEKVTTKQVCMALSQIVSLLEDCYEIIDGEKYVQAA